MRIALLAACALAACGPNGASHPRAEDPSRGPLRPLWSVNINENVNPGQDTKAAADPARWHQDFLAARALGFQMVRMDLPWSAFDDGAGGWDAQITLAYREILQDAQGLGLEVQAVVSHVPGAELERYRSGQKDALYADFERYTRMLAETYGSSLRVYQLLNESNGNDFPFSAEDTWQLFLAGDRGVRAGDPDHECAINYLGYVLNGGNWIDDAERAMDFVNRADPENTISLLGVDEYPGTWTFGTPGDFPGVDRLAARLEDPRSALYQMRAGIMETGFSSFVQRQPWLNRPYSAVAQLLDLNSWTANDGGELAAAEQLEAGWYREALPALGERVSAHNARHPGGGFEFVNLYTLHDDFHLADPPFNPESNFGLLHEDLTPKAAAEPVRDFISR